MDKAAQSSSCSCLPLGITSLLQCLGFESKNPTSVESSSWDGPIISAVPPVYDQAKNPSSEESPSSDGQIISVVPVGNDNANIPSSVEYPNSDNLIIDIGLPQSSDEVITIGGGFYNEADNPEADGVPVNHQGNKPSKEIMKGDGLITGGFGFPEENNPSTEEFPNPSSSEQQPVTGVSSDTTNTGMGIPPEWTRIDPRKRTVNIGPPGKTW